MGVPVVYITEDHDDDGASAVLLFLCCHGHAVGGTCYHSVGTALRVAYQKVAGGRHVGWQGKRWKILSRGGWQWRCRGVVGFGWRALQLRARWPELRHRRQRGGSRQATTRWLETRHLKQRPCRRLLKSSGMERPASGPRRACTGRRGTDGGAVAFFGPLLVPPRLLSSVGLVITGRQTFTGTRWREPHGGKLLQRWLLSGITRTDFNFPCCGQSGWLGIDLPLLLRVEGISWASTSPWTCG